MWQDYGQKYSEHEFQQMGCYGIVCEPSLSLIAREQAELNQGFLALVLEKV